MTSTNPIHGAEYKHATTNDLYEFVGFNGGRDIKLIVENKTTQDVTFVTFEEFTINFMDTGNHNHKEYCCSEHKAHTSPHRGCVLR